MEKHKTILIVAGEASGDQHASNLVKALKELYPGLSFFGLGGPKLHEQGVSLSFNLVELAVVGIWEVIKHYGKFKKIFTALLQEIDEKKPDAAIVIDYPGFNLKLAHELKKRNIPVIYYISPQLWAWGKERINTIKKNVALMIVFFKFEEELYRKADVPVFWCGHPLLENCVPPAPKEQFLSSVGLDGKKITVALLPGSREREVTILLPIMLKAAEIMRGRFKEKIQFIVFRSSSVKNELFTDACAQSSIHPAIVTDSVSKNLVSADFALVASGTATLDTAIAEVPMLILYKTSLLTWVFGSLVIKIPYIGLVNVVRGKKFIEEFIQFDAKPEKIALYAMKIIQDPALSSTIKKELAFVIASLGEKGASQRAAERIAEFLSSRK
ncbi:MAG: lipid-A-disaccharide synthase [Candidatus Omnitrophica bacterium]|nr:lipid-A-disaccharide synthase [Candidatus Omnitrophota bacterium]